METYQEKQIMNKSIFNIIFYYGMSFIGATLISALLVLVPAFRTEVENGDMNNVMLYTNFITYVILFAVLYLVNNAFLKESLRKFLSDIKGSLKMILLGFLTLYVSNVVLSLLYGFMGLENSANQQALTEMVGSSNVFLPFIFMVLIGPITEEIVFRYSLINIAYSFFKKKEMSETKKLYIANVIASLFFGLIHVIVGGDFVFLPLYMVLGLVIGIFYIKTNKNLAVSSGLHILNNLIAFLGMIALNMGA